MKKKLVVALSLLAVLSISVYFRCYPVFMPQFIRLADKKVDQQVEQRIAQDINKTFPALSELAKAKLFDVAVTDYEKTNKKIIQAQKKEELARLKDRFQGPSGQTYLMELDGWSWFRYVENIDRLGRIGDTVKDGNQHDNLMLFPRGEDLFWSDFFYYSSWGIYKIFSLFKPVALINFVFYLPLFFITVFIVLLYLFCYLSWGNTVAVICSLFVGTAPIFLPRSCAGWFDLDILTMIFPLLIVWTYILAYKGSSWGKSVFWAVFAGFWLGLFCLTWFGWSFILFIILFYEFIVLTNCISERLQYGKDISAEVKKHLIVPAIFVFSGVFWIVMFCGVTPFQSLVLQVKDAIHLNNPLTSAIWPNVYSTVGELKKGDYLSIANAVGGVFLLVIILVLMLWSFLKIKKYSGTKRELLIIMVVWFMTMFFLCSKGIRFAIYLLIPMGVFLGWGIIELYDFILEKGQKLFLIPLALVLVWLGGSIIQKADNTGKNCLPLMEDSWYSALTTIRKYTPPDSVLNSWWDYGDWFKTVARRAVIFDGQSQNSPQAYWMARVLITDSEQEALGILRMLNNGGNKAFEIIDKQVPNPFMSVLLLKKAIMLEPEQGRVFLSQYLPPDKAEEVCGLLYSRPLHKAYFIVDSSLIGKMYPISYLGNWDFIKVYLSRVIRSKPKEQILEDLKNFGLTEDQARDYYQEAGLVFGREFDNWVSRRSSIVSISYQRKNDDKLILFNNGYMYDLAKKTIFSYSSYDERYHTPKSLFLFNGESITEDVLPQGDSQYSALFLEEKRDYKLILLSRELGKSVFTRLQFLNGKGLTHFKPFLREGAEDNRILVYEVNWD
jgi:dolichyl-diphosphooligosaccharide--protein glycosyltransferase